MPKPDFEFPKENPYNPNTIIADFLASQSRAEALYRQLMSQAR